MCRVICVLAACGLSACGAQNGSPAVKLMGQSAGPMAAGVSQHSTLMVTAKHTRLLCAAPGSFLRLASSKSPSHWDTSEDSQIKTPAPVPAGSSHSALNLYPPITKFLRAAPGSFLRLASSKNITVEGGLPAATWREVHGLHPDVDLQDMGRHWMSLWIPVTELQVCEWSL